MTQDALYPGSLVALPEFKQCNKNMTEYIRSVQSVVVDQRSADTTNKSVSALLRDMFDLSLLSSPTFLLICFAGFLAWAGQSNTTIHSAFFTPASIIHRGHRSCICQISTRGSVMSSANLLC